MTDLSEIIDDVYDGKWIDFNTLEKGRFFIRKLRDDIINLKKIIDKYRIPLTTEGRISGESFFPLTIEVLNREEAPGRDDIYVGGMLTVEVIYYGICPELENFVSIRLWPKYSKSSQKAYKLIYDLIKNDIHREKVLSFKEKYQLRLPNEIHPFWDREINSIPKSKYAYDWRFVPYLKEIGDTIYEKKSPLNFRKVYLDSTKNIKKYINLKTTVGTITERLGNEVRLRLPNATKSFTVAIDSSVLNQLSNSYENKIFHFLIFEEVDDKPNPVIHEISEATSIDCLGHLLSYKLYRTYIENRRFYLMSKEEFHSLFVECLNILKIFTKGQFDSDYRFYTEDMIFNAYLKTFFKWINNSLYFVPYAIREFLDSEIILYDETLAKFKNLRFWGGKNCIVSKDGVSKLEIVGDFEIYRKLKFIIENKNIFGNIELLDYR